MNYKEIDIKGGKWLISCLDPFHDYQMSISGYPDMISGGSLVQLHTQNLSITHPAGVAGNWDCSVCYTGFDTLNGTSYPIGGTVNATVFNYDHAASHIDLASFMITSAAAGTSLIPGNVGTENQTLDSILTTSGDMLCRVIGVAYEVHNSTAEVYRQGSVTTAMLPLNAEGWNCICIDTNVAPWDDREFMYSRAFSLPVTEDQVRSIPSSNTWEARDGVYAIPRLGSMEIKPHSLIQYNRGVLFGTIGSPFGSGSIPSSADASGIPTFNGITCSSFQPTISFFNGLSNETVLMVTVKTIVEYFPASSSSLVSLARPSCPFDSSALELYSDVCMRAAYAVKVKMNAAGEYFKSILRLIRDVAPMVGTVVPHPAGQLTGQVVGSAAGGALQVYELLEKSRKKKQRSRQEAGSMAIASK